MSQLCAYTAGSYTCAFITAVLLSTALFFFFFVRRHGRNTEQWLSGFERLYVSVIPVRGDVCRLQPPAAVRGHGAVVELLLQHHWVERLPHRMEKQYRSWQLPRPRLPAGAEQQDSTSLPGVHSAVCFCGGEGGRLLRFAGAFGFGVNGHVTCTAIRLRYLQSR